MSLSNKQVISLLNSHFVPVYIANEDYRANGTATPAEKAFVRRIHQEGHAAKLSVGSVHAYVIGPDGHLIDTLHVVQAAKSAQMIAMLERCVSRLMVPAGEPVVKPSVPSLPPVEPGSLRLNIVARYLERKGDDYALTVDHGGGWAAFPGEDHVVLSAEECQKLLPGKGKPELGQTWALDPELSAKILTRFYPPTENNDLRKNQFHEQVLRAKVIPGSGGPTRAWIDGTLKMKHPFYHKDDDREVEAAIAGYLDWDPARGEIKTLRLVTDRGIYRTGTGGGGLPFGVAVQSEPRRKAS